MKTQAIAAPAVLTALAFVAHADPVQGIYTDSASCDNHGNRISTEEFGDPSVFGQTQWIRHASTFTQDVACPMTDDPTLPNSLVEITNLTGRSLTDLFYVGDASLTGIGNTTFSNVDGLASQLTTTPPLAALAFRIDSIGMNRNLVFESITANNVFEPGETWAFIVQDYHNDLGLAPDAFFSVGYADGSPAPGSSASIVQFVPAPGAASLAALGGLAIARRRR